MKHKNVRAKFQFLVSIDGNGVGGGWWWLCISITNSWIQCRPCKYRVPATFSKDSRHQIFSALSLSQRNNAFARSSLLPSDFTSCRCRSGGTHTPYAHAVVLEIEFQLIDTFSHTILIIV